MPYIPRIADDVLVRGLKSSGAVLIEGTKACGKTETATRIAGSVSRFDTDPDVAIKMGAGAIDEAAANLLALAAKIDTRKTPPPSFLGVITGNGFAHRRKDGVCAAPLATLCP